jgi:Na+/H+ antiporter NhaD/arsenite permease-like protein
MMIIVAILSESGIFQWVGIKATKVSGGNLWKLLLILCTFTAVVSMFIDNVTTILLMIPVTVSVFRTFKISPIPFAYPFHCRSGSSFKYRGNGYAHR